MPKTFAMQQPRPQSYVSSLDAYVECADEYSQSNGSTGSDSAGSGSTRPTQSAPGRLDGREERAWQEELFENRYTYEKMEQHARCSMMARITGDEGWLMDPEDDEEKPRLGGSPGDGLRLTNTVFLGCKHFVSVLFLFKQKTYVLACKNINVFTRGQTRFALFCVFVYRYITETHF